MMLRIDYVLLYRVVDFLWVISHHRFCICIIKILNNTIGVVIRIVRLLVGCIEHVVRVKEIVDFTFFCAIIMTRTPAHHYSKSGAAL